MEYKVRQTGHFAKWFAGLRDERARQRIQARIDRLELGNPGDCKSVGLGISEMRIDYGPGYRVYFIRRDKVVFVLLAGGDKRSQRRAIAMAVEIVTSGLE